jgi:hypothetical protein
MSTRLLSGLTFGKKLNRNSNKYRNMYGSSSDDWIYWHIGYKFS